MARSLLVGIACCALAGAGAGTTRAQEPGLEPLLIAFGSEDDGARQEAARAVAELVRGQPLERPAALQRLRGVLGEALATAERERRWDPRARPALQALLALEDHAAPRVLLEAIEHRPPLRRDLLGLLATLPSLPLEGLMEPPEQVLLRVLRPLMSDPARRYERGLILQLLGRSGHYEVVDPLADLLERWPDERLAQEVLAALNQLTGTDYTRPQDWQRHWAQEQAPAWRRADELLATAQSEPPRQAAQALRQLEKLRDRRLQAEVAALDLRRASRRDGQARLGEDARVARPGGVAAPPSRWRWAGFAVVALLALAAWTFTPRDAPRRVRLLDLRSVGRLAEAPATSRAEAEADAVVAASERFAEGLEALRCLEQAGAEQEVVAGLPRDGVGSASSGAAGVVHVAFAPPGGTVPVSRLFAAVSPPAGVSPVGGTVPVSQLFGPASALPPEPVAGGTVPVAQLFDAPPPVPASAAGGTVPVAQLFGAPPPVPASAAGGTVPVAQLFGASPPLPPAPEPAGTVPAETVPAGTVPAGTVPVGRLFGPRAGLTRHQMQGLEGLWRCLSEPAPSQESWERTRGELESALAALPLDARVLLEQALELLEQARLACADGAERRPETEQAWLRVLSLLYGLASQEASPSEDQASR